MKASIMSYFPIMCLHVCDKVTGFKGVAESVSFDIYGCVQVVVRPQMNELVEGRWFDHKRLEIQPDAVRVMDVPFEEFKPGVEAGCADKPLPRS